MSEVTPTHTRPGGARDVIVVFAKQPRPGLVKTRMTPPLSPEQASELYEYMLDDVLEATAHFAASLDLVPYVALHPAEACADVVHGVPRAFSVIAQNGVGLGERMRWAIAEAAATGAHRVLVRGSDSPMLGLEQVAAAHRALADHDLVITPDLDGGYSMIGLRAPAPGLFEHPMSTGSVLEETLASADRLGLRHALMEPSFDVDHVTDLEVLARRRGPAADELCPRTLAYLDARDLWPATSSPDDTPSRT